MAAPSSRLTFVSTGRPASSPTSVGRESLAVRRDRDLGIHRPEEDNERRKAGVYPHVMSESNSVVQADERDSLSGFLDFYRGVIDRKLDGLSLTNATKQLTPTGLSVLGVVRHLGWVEYYWFRHCFAGENVPPPPREGNDNAIQFRIQPSETVVSVLDFYNSESIHSREVTAAADSLDTLSVRENPHFGRVSLRWILIHMVEETARHAGHIDIMREMLDGATGYL